MKQVAYIWGAADSGRSALEYCNDKFDILGFIDRRAGNIPDEFCQKPVISPSEFFSLEGGTAAVIVAVKFPAQVLNLMNEKGVSAKEVYFFDGRPNHKPYLYRIADSNICTPEYMNNMYSEFPEYLLHYTKTHKCIRNMFSKAAEFLSGCGKGVEIYEIGCGSGQFANMLFDNGFVNYKGFDFSEKAVSIAKAANPDYADKFVCADAFELLPTLSGKSNAVFFCFEVLEHIKDDKKLLDLLPKGSTVIFSVPNFYAFNHIRTFENTKQIYDRYTNLEISDCVELAGSDKPGSDSVFFLTRGVKK